MPNAIRYRVLTDVPLTLVFYDGVVDIHHFYEHVKNLGSDPDYNPGYNAISDFGNSSLVVSQQQIKEIAEYFMENRELVAKRKHAFVTRTAEQMAKISLFSIYTRILPVEYSVVSSMEEAYRFIGLNGEHFPTVMNEFELMK